MAANKWRKAYNESALDNPFRESYRLSALKLDAKRAAKASAKADTDNAQPTTQREGDA